MAERMDDDRTTRSGVSPYAGSTRGGANMHDSHDSNAGRGEAGNPTAIRADGGRSEIHSYLDPDQR